MAKSPAAKTNGHTVSALKAATAKKSAAKPAPRKAAAVKPAAKPPAKVAVKRAAKPAVKTAAKPPVKPAAKPAVKPAAKPAVKPMPKPAPVKAAAPVMVEPEKVRKAKLVRDSFTMPELEYAVLGQVKKACIKAGFEIKKSELLRIGVALISQLDTATLQEVLASLPQLKTGRPRNE